MKQMILGLALVACVVACKSSSNTSVTDPANANMPNCEGKKECSGEQMKECSGEKMKECSGEKAKSCCPSQKPQG